MGDSSEFFTLLAGDEVDAGEAARGDVELRHRLFACGWEGAASALLATIREATAAFSSLSAVLDEKRLRE